MPRVEMCQDGIGVTLLDENGVWFVLHRDDDELARFAADVSEVRATLMGRLTLQFTDGAGNGVSVEGASGGLRIRLEGEGHAPKNCRIPVEDVENIRRSLNYGV